MERHKQADLINETSIFDLGRVPFSRFGLWMVMGQRSGNRLILKNVHNQGEALFQLIPVVDGRAHGGDAQWK